MSQTEFGRAVRRQLESQGRTLTWLQSQLEAEPAAQARMQGKTLPWSTVQNWLDRFTPDPHIAFAIERITGAKPGALSKLLGYVPVEARPSVTVLQAIDADPKLDELARRLLRTAYQELTR